MNSKELFLKQTALRDKLVAVTKADWFLECLVYARSEMMTGAPSNAEVTGANLFQAILLELADHPEPEAKFLSSGMIHDMAINKSHKTTTT